MENSRAYIYLCNQFGAVGRERDLFIDKRVLNELYEFERPIIEAKVADFYMANTKDYRWVELIGNFKTIDGLEILNQQLKNLIFAPFSRTIFSNKMN